MFVALTAMTLALLCVAPLSAQGDFNDDFGGPELDARWQWRTPVEGPTMSLTDSPGNLRVSVPQRGDGFNHWVDAGEAPMLLAQAPEGDFSVETRMKLVSFSPESNFHMALVVAFSPAYVASWGPFLAPVLGNPTGAPQVWCEPTGQARLLAVEQAPKDLCLRIEKSGREYTFSMKEPDEADWRSIGQWSSVWPPTHIGFLGKTFAGGPGVIVDLDYIKLEGKPATEPEPYAAKVRVNCDGDTWPLDRKRFGHFIEHMFRAIYGGVWAEMLENRKFTGAINVDGVVESWRAEGKRDGVSFSRDNASYYCPAQSQRIEIQTAGAPAGIAQARVGLRPGVQYQARLVARQEGLGAPVVVQLATDSGPVSRVELTDIGADWTVCEFALDGPAEECRATFSIATSGPGKLWLGAVSLMPDDNVDGFRADTLAAMREMMPPVLRWPGGNFVSGHDWRDAIGERDKRPPRWNRAWGGWEWHDVGTDEFIRLCELLDTEPYICVNCGEGRASEAAAWVQYCNGDAATPWGKVRAANGHPDPYNVEIWGIGNEIYGPWQLGHLNAERYGIKAVEFAGVMRAEDPSIKLVGVGVEGDGWGHWNREVCSIAGSWFDWLSVHTYVRVRPDLGPVANYMTAVGASAGIERMLNESYNIARDASGKHLPIAFDEWNVTLDGDPPYALRDGLFACLVFNSLNRLGDKCPMANLAQIVNVIGAIRTNATQVVRTPLHSAFELYSNYSGSVGVAVETDVSQVHFPGGGQVPALDVVASMSDDGQTLYVTAVNRLPTDAVSAELDLTSFQPTGTVKVISLNAEDFNAVNTFAKPDTVKLSETTLAAAKATKYEFPPHSATVMIWRK